MSASSEELAAVTARLSELRQEEGKRYWAFVKPLTVALVLCVGSAFLALAIKAEPFRWIVFGLGTFGWIAAVTRSIVLFLRWWPLGVERNRLRRRRSELRHLH